MSHDASHKSFEATPVRRPRLALVLGSGGVRSAAAIGIAHVLAKGGMQPDIVVGCSSGAIFGATVALGLSAEQSLRLTTELWSQDLTEQKRWRAYLQLLAPRLAGFDEGFSLRSTTLIAQRLDKVFGHLRLEDLHTPLRVAATDARTGEPVTLTRGPMARAILASLSVPFLFPSVEFEGRRLVDGVVSDPLPLAAAQDADVVLVLGFRGAMPRRVNRVSRMVAQVSTTLINNLYDARLDAARQRGQQLIELEIDLPARVGLWDTAMLPEAYMSGVRATTDALPAICHAMDTPVVRRVA